MSYKNKTHSIVITTTARESFESVLQQAEEAAEAFIEADDGSASEFVLNMDHISSAFYGKWGRGGDYRKWDLKYEFTLHYKVYKTETADERMTRTCRGMKAEGEPQIDLVVTEEHKKQVAKRLKEIEKQGVKSLEEIEEKT